MNTSLGKNIAASIIFAGGVFVLMAAGSIYSITQMQTASDWVAHTEEVKTRLNGVLAAVVSWESANRGYIITGDEAFITPFKNAQVEMDDRLNKLRGSVADNLTQTANVKKLVPLVHDKIVIMEHGRQSRQDAGFAAAAAVVGSGEGRKVMDNIRDLITQMRTTENALLQQREDENAAQTRQSIVAALATSAVGLLVLGATGWTIVRQLNARRKTEAKLAKSEANLQSVMDHSPMGIFLKDLEGRYLLLNDPMQQLHGRTASECIGKLPGELFSAERAAQIQSEDAAVLDTKNVRAVEYTADVDGGAKRIYRTLKFPLRDAEGRIYAIGGISEDVTEFKHLEQALRSALQTAESASRTKSQFLANMSHELRTPLNSVIGFSEIMSDQLFGPLNGKQQQYITNILASGRHLLLLINDLLDLAKIEAGKMQLDPERTRADSVITEGGNLVRGIAERKGVALEVQSGNANFSVRLDPARTRQIIYNLLSNAVKFTLKGGRVTISAELVAAPVCPPRGGPAGANFGELLPGKWLHLLVTDTGMGIAADDLERIFQEFEQLDSSYARHQEGTGLGLALTRKLVELHGGYVWAESPGQINQGSTFHVLLPQEGVAVEKEKTGPVKLVTPAQVTQELTAAGVAAPSVDGTGRPLILVIEDDLPASDLISEYLHAGGYAVMHASTAEEGLRLAAELHPAAITLDIQLPDANGMDVLARLKATRSTSLIPVIIVSVTDDRQMGMSLGAAEFFVKPVSAEKLMAALARVRVAAQREITDVLVVDDEQSAREGIVAILEPRGYRVRASASGEEALRLIAESPPDVAIIDLTMPGMTGFELVNLLRQKPETAHLPICIYTAKDLSSSELRWLHEQTTAITPKPFREQLLAELQRVCTNAP